MSIQETFPEPEPQFYKHYGQAWNRDKDTQAMGRVWELFLSMGRCRMSGITYAEGSWGYTVLRTVYSDESHTLWPIVMEKMKRWVTQYFIHQNRLIKYKPDASVNEELARRFILEIIEDKDSMELKLPDLARANQSDIETLTKVFETWRDNAVGDVEFDPLDNPRFCDFLVIDENALRSLAALPDNTPPLGPVTRAERRSRDKVFNLAHVWLVDSAAVRRFKGVEDADNYNGLMKLQASDVPNAWFERLATFEMENFIFNRVQHLDESEDKWYCEH